MERNEALLLAHIGLLAITVKLYTEILKDRKFDDRSKKHAHDGGVATR